jgi:MFS family permease
MKERRASYLATMREWRESYKEIEGYLWIGFVLRFLSGFTSYSIDSNSMIYITEVFDKSIMEGGGMYSVQSLSDLFLGIPGAILVDWMGASKSLYLGFAMSVLGCLILGFTTDYTIAMYTLNVLLTPSGKFVTFALRIMCSSSTPTSIIRVFIFLHFAHNFGATVASYLSPLMMGDYHHLGMHRFQYMFYINAGVSIIAIPLIFFGVSGYISPAFRRPNLKQIFSDTSFHKLMALSSIFMFVRSVSGNLQTILPVYIKNVYQGSLNYNYVVALDPLVICILTVVSSFYAFGGNVLAYIFAGTIGSALSPFWVSLWRPENSSSWPPYLFIVTHTISEFLYAPQLAALIAVLPPAGSQAFYFAVSSIPAMFGEFFTGIESAYLLKTFCPIPITKNYDYWGLYSCANIWFETSLKCIITPILLFFTYKWFVKPAQSMIVESIEMPEVEN